LGERELFAQGEIPRVAAGAFDAADARCTAPVFGRRSESRSVEPARNATLVIGQFDGAAYIVSAPIAGQLGVGGRSVVLPRLPARDSADLPAAECVAQESLRFEEEWNTISISSNEDVAAVETGRPVVVSPVVEIFRVVSVAAGIGQHLAESIARRHR